MGSREGRQKLIAGVRWIHERCISVFVGEYNTFRRDPPIDGGVMSDDALYSRQPTLCSFPSIFHTTPRQPTNASVFFGSPVPRP